MLFYDMRLIIINYGINYGGVKMAFCSNCGNQLQNGVSFCSNCGARVGETEKNSFDYNIDKERILLEGLCNRIKSVFNVQGGHAILTNKRFIYNKHSFAKIAAMGILVNFTKGTYDFDIDLTDIVQVKDGRQGFVKTIVMVNKSGEEYSFSVFDRQRWVIELTNLLGKEKVICTL